ncbi:hypothetical protein NE236_13525 [Actinoallomurus purpureus]|uniref:hypothetical protein n=1 Tax=Actinoallomurus purpureus TaxID=478114 RepID=UPI002093448B|nr:hypothetical protein [Actinoallomurus purpureus]MCO6006007.1 hypothetical protein [Actinoallomurus purpureus]
MSWCAFVDESESNRKLDPDVYILVASIMASDIRESVREVMACLRLPGEHKVHWYHESDKRRRILIETVISLEVLHLAVVRTGAVGETSERRRRKCMERLFFELSAMGAHKIIFEAREARQSRNDLNLVKALRSRREIHADIRVDHLSGPREPLLWIPDLVAGAVVAARCGDRSYLDQIAPLVTVCVVEA